MDCSLSWFCTSLYLGKPSWGEICSERREDHNRDNCLWLKVGMEIREIWWLYIHWLALCTLKATLEYPWGSEENPNGALTLPLSIQRTPLIKGTVFFTLPHGLSTVARTIKIMRFICRRTGFIRQLTLSLSKVWGLTLPLSKLWRLTLPLLKCEGSHVP